jgi:predicted nucleotidyltransferase
LWDGRSLDDWTHDLVRELVILVSPVEVWLFGSLARGDDNGDSDIDLLVVLDHYDPRAAVDLKQRASQATMVRAPFDVSFTDVERMRKRRRIVGALERAAANEGRAIYRRE